MSLTFNIIITIFFIYLYYLLLLSLPYPITFAGFTRREGDFLQQQITFSSLEQEFSCLNSSENFNCYVILDVL